LQRIDGGAVLHAVRERFQPGGILRLQFCQFGYDILPAPSSAVIPLHISGLENDIRACVTKHKISGGTMSTAGRTVRDGMLGLMKTCSKLKVSFFRYLSDRLSAPGAIVIPRFQLSCVRPQAQPDCSGIYPGYTPTP
jgi:hypothetical protein